MSTGAGCSLLFTPMATIWRGEITAGHQELRVHSGLEVFIKTLENPRLCLLACVVSMSSLHF